MKHLLIVDDEKGARESLRAIFEREYRVSAAADAAQAINALSREPVDLLLLDIIMPDKDGITFLREAREMYPGLPVIMVSASTSVRSVVESMRIGACDFVAKPFDVEELRRLVRRSLQSDAMERQVQVLRSTMDAEYPVDGIIGHAATFRAVLADARKAAATDATVLIEGESGTGKELVARMIHQLGPRAAEPFVPVHCGALSESLMESELFGHEKGAFTGADRRKLGRFDLAGSGTLFFDEVSEMSPATQVKLLRVLQEHEFMRVGGTRIIPTNARILAASNVNLREAIEAGTFRSDLYYRLSVVPIELPPLRDRMEDIPLLSEHFLHLYKQRMHVACKGFSADAMERFCAYPWPGNVRELRNVVERMLVLHGKNAMLRVEHLPPEFQFQSDPAKNRIGLDENPSLTKAVEAFERKLVEQALVEANGVQTRAAELLGTTRRILKYRMDKLCITPPNGQP